MQQFARFLSDRGDTVDVISARRPGAPAFESLGRINVYRIGARNTEESGWFVYLEKVFGFLLRATVVVARKQRKAPYDLVHVQSVPDFLVFSAAYAKLTGTPIILDLRDLVPELCMSRFKLSDRSILFRLLKLVERWSASFADHVIVANQIWYERVTHRTVDKSKCTAIWYSPDLTLFARRPPAPRGDRFVIMYPGTLSPHQGVDLVVRAMPEIVAAIPGAELHIYGEGKSRASLAELASDLGVSGAVHFYDMVSVPVLVKRMAEAHLSVVPKRASDPFGNEAASTKIPEFQAMGIPVVASSTEIETRLYDPSQVCFFRSDDVSDLVRAVLSLYKDSDLAERLAQNAWETVKSRGQEVEKKYLSLVDALVSRKKPG
jgi:glycosyltransferase involved in cell wall biosynthesis